jgi:hypothetical protein
MVCVQVNRSSCTLPVGPGLRETTCWVAFIALPQLCGFGLPPLRVRPRTNYSGCVPPLPSCSALSANLQVRAYPLREMEPEGHARQETKRAGPPRALSRGVPIPTSPPSTARAEEVEVCGAEQRGVECRFDG